MDDNIFNQDNVVWANPIRELTGIYASVIFIDGKATRYFIDEIATQRSKLFLSKSEYIKTYYLPTPNDVISFLETFDYYCGATEIEV